MSEPRPMSELLWHAYKSQFAFQFGELGALIVKEVDEGRKTPDEAMALFAKAYEGSPCDECGRDCEC